MSFTAKDILQMQVAPALGCTEPVAIALGAAAAASLLEDRGRIDAIEIWLDPNIYKNGLGVIIPGTRGMIGLGTSAVLGALAGDPTLGLEVLEPINDNVVDKAKKFLDEKEVVVNLRDEQGLYIRSVLKSGDTTAESLITQLHNNIVQLKYNNRTIHDSPLLSKQHNKSGSSRHEELENWLKEQTLADLVADCRRN